jgi:hypothetical protein
MSFAFHAADEVGATVNAAPVVIGIGSGRPGRAGGHTRHPARPLQLRQGNIQMALAAIVRAARP